MFKRLKRGFKKVLVFLLILTGLAVTVMTVINMRSFFSRNEVMNIIIDVGTGQDFDDLSALLRALIAPELKVNGIISSYSPMPSNTRVSYPGKDRELQEIITGFPGSNGIPTLKGSEDKLDLQAGLKPRSSEAVAFIIREANKKPKGEKLTIVNLGASTNLAVALLTDPSIAPKIRLYALGAKYDAKSGVWNKNEINIRNDLDAFDLLLDTPELEIHLLPANIAQKLIISREDVYQLMQGKRGVWELLLKKWQGNSPLSAELSLQGAALIEALISPQFARLRTVNSPPENFRRQINVYSYINTDQMLFSFENAIKKAIKDSE